MKSKTTSLRGVALSLSKGSVPSTVIARQKPEAISRRSPSLILCIMFLTPLFWRGAGGEVLAQNNTLLLNGAYMPMNGGTSATPIYLVVNQSNASGITRLAGGGHIISENEYNIVKWNNLGTTIGTYTFPLGKGTTTYIPFVFDKTTAGTVATTGSVSLSTWYTLDNAVVPTTASGVTMCPSEANAIDRFWVVDVNGYSANPTATVDFYYKDDATELDGLPEANLKAQRWNAALGGSCKWESPVGTVNTTDNYVRVGNISSFSPWTLTDSDNPLPIELLSFKVRWKDANYTAALAEWTTASETNSDYFVVERSLDAINFTTVLWKKGAGNSNSLKSYNGLDTNPYSDRVSYYRLKQVDNDANYTLSKVEVLNAPEGLSIVNLFGNPVADKLTIDLLSSLDTGIDIDIINNLGQTVMHQTAFIEKGSI